MGRCLKWTGIGLMGFVVLVIVVGVFAEPAETSQTARNIEDIGDAARADIEQRGESAREDVSQFFEGLRGEPSPTPEPAPTSQETLHTAIVDTLGSSNRDVERLAEVAYVEGVNNPVVTWAINDNLTEGFIKRGAKMDVMKILEAVHTSGVPYNEVVLDGTYSLVDTLGNVSERRVLLMRYDHETVSKINWTNFNTDNAYVIASEAWLHPAFQD